MRIVTRNVSSYNRAYRAVEPAMKPVAGNLATGTPAGGLWMWVGQRPR